MPTLKETPHTGAFVVSESNGTRSRELITIASGRSLLAGTVLGQITASKKYVALDPAANDGSEAAAGVLFADVDATDADTPGVGLVRDAEVDRNLLVYPAGTSAGAKTTAEGQLATRGLIVR